jgi:hypothetical protein
LDLVPAGQKLHAIDVEANVGRWSAAMLTAARQAGRLENLHLEALEPSAHAFGLLAKALDGQPVGLHNMPIAGAPRRSLCTALKSTSKGDRRCKSVS